MSQADASVIAHQFDDLNQQHEADVLGMWVFLVTEIMMFGGLFAGCIIYRTLYPATFAEGTQHLNLLLGSINTVVLLTSDLALMIAIHASQRDRRVAKMLFLCVTIALGIVFLGIKGTEYAEKFHDHLVPGPTFNAAGAGSLGPLQLFFSFYFVMTGLHALHLIVGIVALLIVLFIVWRGRPDSETHRSLFITGLYWHFVDCVWIFLFTILYLIGGRS